MEQKNEQKCRSAVAPIFLVTVIELPYFGPYKH
jgi:hypothetical protein